ncbi:hypothetical protein [Actinacidiphila sp. bgisy160]|uniref:hypothetical protein n=1 Tax=Actinacidiphila sp. bgisy160 TaxID=3413796 RepID=UPI003D75B25D
MTGLTAAALAGVGVLAVQASSSADEMPKGVRSTDTGGARDTSVAASASPEPAKKNELPAASGSGTRVVYSLGADRVWLVGDDGKVRTTYVVVPGTVDPAPGTYSVTSRSAGGVGGDGVAVENVVRFTTVDNVVIGFSAAKDGSLPDPPPPGRQTGGIREKRKDGATLWKFATVGSKIVVVR